MKQFMFPKIMDCQHRYPNGTTENVRYGQYECIMITHKNGYPVDRSVLLVMGRYLVTELTKTDGTIVILSEPFELIYENTHADGRPAKKGN